MTEPSPPLRPLAPELAPAPAPAPPSVPPAATPRVPMRALLGVAAVAAAIGGAVARSCAPEAPPVEPTVTTVVRPTPDVVVAVRSLARLESTSYHVERVVDLRDQQSVLFGFTTAEDAILLVAAGDVVAGVDLARLRPEDVVVSPDRQRVALTLPAVEVFSARLDASRTFVYARETDTLARRSESLETRARAEAESTLQRAAVEAGILTRGRAEARRTVEGLLRSLGFVDVTVRFADDER